MYEAAQEKDERLVGLGKPGAKGGVRRRIARGWRRDAVRDDAYFVCRQLKHPPNFVLHVTAAANDAPCLVGEPPLDAPDVPLQVVVEPVVAPVFGGVHRGHQRQPEAVFERFARMRCQPVVGVDQVKAFAAGVQVEGPLEHLEI
ncbi:MAG: hypothetical protein BAA04_00720 [Firmicutes bacterium ZCTH02-B6]|nr:MAG: hypothetical protein BAA04_00720 [Firmicutes bacterium ZCTH02-B6]